MKKKTIKKEIKVVEPTEVTEELVIVPLNQGIAKLGLDLGREDLNKLVEKLNEVIDRLNK